MPPKKTKKQPKKTKVEDEDIEQDDVMDDEDIMPDEIDDTDADDAAEDETVWESNTPNDDDADEDEEEEEPEKPTREEKLESFDEFMGSKNPRPMARGRAQRPHGAHDIPLKLYRRIALGFIIVTGGLLVFMLVFSATSATISITPKKEQISVSLLRTVGPAGAGAGDRVEGAVFVESIEYSETFSVEEGREVEGFASGNMKIINDSDAPISLIPRTRFQSESGVIFRIAQRVNVPANGSTVAPVTADVKGKEGEVPQGNFTIPGLPLDQQREVYGESVADMTGGVRIAGVLTQADVAKAEDVMRENIKKQKLEQYRSSQSYSSNKVSLDVKEQKVSAQVGDEVDSFTLTIKGQLTAVFFDGDTLDTLTRQAVFAKVPNDKRLHTVGDARYELENVDAQEKTATLKLIRSGEVTLDPSAPSIAPAKFINLSKEDAARYIDSLGVASDYEVRIRPKWRDKTPGTPDRVKVEVK